MNAGGGNTFGKRTLQHLSHQPLALFDLLLCTDTGQRGWREGTWEVSVVKSQML